MPTEEKIIPKTFPVLALRGLVAFPNMMLTLDVGRKKSIKALNRTVKRLYGLLSSHVKGEHHIRKGNKASER